jgi:hypothetical protein
LICGAGATPVPVSDTLWGLPGKL